MMSTLAIFGKGNRKVMEREMGRQRRTRAAVIALSALAASRAARAIGRAATAAAAAALLGVHVLQRLALLDGLHVMIARGIDKARVQLGAGHVDVDV